MSSTLFALLIILAKVREVLTATLTQPAVIETPSTSESTETATLTEAQGQITYVPKCEGGCQIAAQLAPIRTAPSSSDNRKSVLSAKRSSIFTAFTLFSSQDVNGDCRSTSFASTLPDAFTVTEAATVTGTNFSSAAINSFISFIGFTRCQGGGEEIYTTILAQLPNATETTPSLVLSPLRTGSLGSITRNTTADNPSKTSPSNSTSITIPTGLPSKPGLNTRTKIALGVGVPAATIATCIILAISIRRYRKNKRERLSREKSASPEEDQPYFQQKGELEAEERRRYELDTERRRHELDGSNEIHEMPANIEELMNLHRQELRGQEHCKEMGAEALSVPRSK